MFPISDAKKISSVGPIIKINEIMKALDEFGTTFTAVHFKKYSCYVAFSTYTVFRLNSCSQRNLKTISTVLYKFNPFIEFYKVNFSQHLIYMKIKIYASKLKLNQNLKKKMKNMC